MIVLDAPFASPALVDWACASQHPVLNSPFTRELAKDAPALNLVGEDEAAARIANGERVYTNSENALAWVCEHGGNAEFNRIVRLCKDKGAMREALASINPDVFYVVYTQDELAAVDPASLPLPVVLKPAVGFCSMGVYVISTPADWATALDDIRHEQDTWATRYPESVVDARSFVIESYIEGDEYAIDVYFDEKGAPVILNILRHDFASPEDTSDRLYVTSAGIIANVEPRLAAWLGKANEALGARDFAAHVEIRMDDDGNIAPIEFNPARFAGLGGTDVALYAWGLRTYEAFLTGAPVNLHALVSGHEEDTYTMSLLGPAPDANLAAPFDYDALTSRFTDVLGLTPFDVNAVGSYGFLFLHNTPDTMDELDWLLHSGLREFERET